jgi:beta-galactosidase GanA
MKYASKIRLTGDDFVLVGMNYNYFMIPRLAYPKDNLEKLKQQILDNQEMIAELKAHGVNKFHVLMKRHIFFIPDIQN